VDLQHDRRVTVRAGCIVAGCIVAVSALSPLARMGLRYDKQVVDHARLL
jgi:hypothetical protein